MPGSRRKILDHVFTGLCARMNRRKKIADDVLDVPLRTSLSTGELALLGIGNMVVVGAYVVVGCVARGVAGPGVVLSFLVAGVAALLATLCYADLSAAHPRAGSAYAYVYASLGEFWAFVVGWNLILEHVIGGAALARALSGYVDLMSGGLVRNVTRAVLGQASQRHGQGLSPPVAAILHANSSAGAHGSAASGHAGLGLGLDVDVLAMGAVLAMGVVLSAGRRGWGWGWGSALIGGSVVVINLGVVAVFIVMGFIGADLRNWTYTNIGGSTPYDWHGVVVGAATCTYAFSAVETVSAAGQETRRPAVSIPSTGLLAAGVTLSAYLLLASALTLSVPHNAIDPSAALPQMLSRLEAQSDWTGWLAWVRVVLTVCAVCAMGGAILTALQYVPRAIQALAIDGLLFSFLGRLHAKTHVPLSGLVLATLTSACFALVLDLRTLVELLSAGTLLCHLALGCGVLLLRYRPLAPPDPRDARDARDALSSARGLDPLDSPGGLSDDSDTLSVASELASPASEVSAWNVIAMGSAPPAPPVPAGALRSGRGCSRCLRALGLHAWRPGALVSACLLAYLLLAAFMFLLLRGGVTSYAGAAVVLLSLAGLGGLMLCISAHQQGGTLDSSGAFRAPLVPWMPAIAILLNMQLLMHLPELAWLRCAVWMALGLAVYFLYGIRHSSEAERRSSYSVLLGPGPGACGGGGASWGASWGSKGAHGPTPATAPMLHAPQPPSSLDKLPILDHEDLHD